MITQSSAQHPTGQLLQTLSSTIRSHQLYTNSSSSESLPANLDTSPALQSITDAPHTPAHTTDSVPEQRVIEDDPPPFRPSLHLPPSLTPPTYVQSPHIEPLPPTSVPGLEPFLLLTLSTDQHSPPFLSTAPNTIISVNPRRLPSVPVPPRYPDRMTRSNTSTAATVANVVSSSSSLNLDARGQPLTYRSTKAGKNTLAVKTRISGGHGGFYFGQSDFEYQEKEFLGQKSYLS